VTANYTGLIDYVQYMNFATDEKSQSNVLRSPPASSRAVKAVMQANRWKDTKPEIILRKNLRKLGITGYRLYWPIPGRPDIAFPGRRICILVQGCFWHRCPHCKLPLPRTNADYWIEKFKRNTERDIRKERERSDLGWITLVYWECEVLRDPFKIAMKIKEAIKLRPA